MSPLRWTCKSTRQLAAALNQYGHQVSERIVRDLLHEAGYSLQANAKTLEGSRHPDRDAQFRYLNDQIKARLAQGLPVVSVDTKKKELVGVFKILCFLSCDTRSHWMSGQRALWERRNSTRSMTQARVSLPVPDPDVRCW